MYGNSYEDQIKNDIEELNKTLKNMPPDTFNIFGRDRLQDNLIAFTINNQWYTRERYSKISNFALNLDSIYVQNLIHKEPEKTKNALLTFILLCMWSLQLANHLNSASGSRKYTLAIRNLYVDITQPWPHAEITGEISVSVDGSIATTIDFAVNLWDDKNLFETDLEQTRYDITIQEMHHIAGASFPKTSPMKSMSTTLKSLTMDSFQKFLDDYLDKILP